MMARQGSGVRRRRWTLVVEALADGPVRAQSCGILAAWAGGWCWLLVRAGLLMLYISQRRRFPLASPEGTRASLRVGRPNGPFSFFFLFPSFFFFFSFFGSFSFYFLFSFYIPLYISFSVFVFVSFLFLFFKDFHFLFHFRFFYVFVFCFHLLFLFSFFIF